MAIVIKTLSDSKQAQADLAKLRESVDGIKSSANQVSNSLANFTKIIGTSLAAFGSFKIFTNYSDQLTNLESKLRIVTDSQEQFAKSLKDVQRIAVSTRTELNSVAGLYTRIAISAKRFGASQSDVSKFTEAVSKSVATSGASLQESQAAIQQLGQALASGRLQGDELRSILENAPPLALAIADGLGVSIGKLRELGETGKLTNVKVFQALLKQQDKINKNFDKMGVTYASAFTNLGNAFTILFAKIKTEVFGTSSSLAAGINSFAVSLIDFANNFSINMSLARASVVLFVLDAVNLFDEFSESIKRTSQEVSSMAQKMYAEWKPVMVSLINDLTVWSITAVQSASQVAKTLYDSFKSTEFGKGLIEGIVYTFSIISATIVKIFNNIKDKIPSIDVSKIFPSLSTALAYLKDWAQQAERWFFWLYDKVIGNSWIPDLVNGVVEWMKKLVGKPLASVIEFASKASNGFKGIKIASVFTTAIAAVVKFRGTLLPLLGILTAIGTAIAAFGFIKSNNFTFDAKGFSGKTQLDLGLNKVESLLQDAIKWLKETYAKIKDTTNASTFMRTVKQVFGIQDTTPGSVFKTPIDTSAKVGRGPMRNQEYRPLGHDIINALPGDWQIPFIATVTGIFALAITKAFEAGTTRTVLLSVLTSVAGIAMAQSVQTAQIKKTFGDAAFGVLNILEKGISAIFSGNVLKDPLGLLSLLAKTALLFQAGREMLMKAGAALAKAPTNMVQTLFTAGEARFAGAKVQSLNKEISNLPTKLNEAFKRNNELSNKTFNALAKSLDQAGNVIGTARARAAITSGTTDAFGVANQAKVAEAIRALQQTTKSLNQVGEVKALRADLVKQRDDLKVKAEELSKQVTETKAAFAQGIKNFAAGAGGILGSFAGFQIGVEIARGMTDAPGWSKVGVIIATTLGAQAIGSAIGLAMSSVLLATASRMGALFVSGMLLLNPFVRGAVIVGAAIYAGYKLFTGLPEQWKEAVKRAFTASPDSLGAGYKKLSSEDPLLFPGGKPVVSEEERAKNLEFLKNLNNAFDTLIVKIKEFTTNLSGNNPVKRATGGFVRGSGTGTSDSIPALLSNGEFVVNAKDAAKNWGLLTAINSGSSISKFATGTATITAASGNVVPVVVQNAKDISIASDKTLSQLLSESFKDGYKLISEAVTKGVGNLDPTKTLGVSTGSTTKTSTPTTLLQRMEGLKSIEQSMGLMQKELAGAGYKNLSIEALKGLSATSVRNISESLDKISELREKSAKRPEGSFLRKQANEAINDLNKQIIDTLSSAGASFEKPSKFIEPSREYKSTELFVKDQLDIINKSFKELELTAEEFYNIPDRLRESVFAKAREIEQKSALIDREYIGLLEEGSSIPKEFFEKRQSIEKQRKELQSEALGQLVDIRTPFANLKGQFTSIGINVGEDYYNALSDVERTTVNELVNAAKEIQISLRKPSSELPQNLRAEAQEQFAGTIRVINEKLAEGAKLGLTKSGKLRFDLNKYNISMDEFAYNMMSDLERETVEAYLKAMNTARDKLALDPKMDENERKRLQTEINKSTEDISKITSRNAPGYKSPGVMAGESFASSLNEGFTTAFTNALKGQSDSNKSVLRTMLDSMLNTISNTVIDTFIKGLLNPLTGEGGILSTMAQDLGASIFGLGNKTSAPATKLISPEKPLDAAKTDNTFFSGLQSTLTSAWDNLSGILSTSWDGLSGMLSKAWSGLTSLFSGGGGGMDYGSVLRLFGGFASGGKISGNGNGTSDSILARVSNGEYIINAKSTQKYLPLLEQINSNKFPKFAVGGLISASLIASPAMAGIKSTELTNKNSNQQIININITGDISRQTRAEIQRMIPNIAVGVNSFNKEKG